MIPWLYAMAALGVALVLGLLGANVRSDRRAAARVRALAAATPPHPQGRPADFDEHGRTWG